MAEKMPFHDCFLVGTHFYDTDTSCKKFRSYESFLEYLNQNPIKKGSLLVKGSRGMALERVLDML